jgi:hypothetical protein
MTEQLNSIPYMNTLNTLPKPQSNTSPEGVNLCVSQQSTTTIAMESEVTPEMQKCIADMAQIE